MRRIVLFAAFFLLCGVQASAQCFVLNYTKSATITWNSFNMTNNTANITVEAIVTGTTTMNSGVCGNNNPIHTPYATLHLNNLQLIDGKGTPVCGSCYLSYIPNLTEDIGFGDDFEADASLSVVCSVAGQLFNWTPSWFGDNFETAITQEYNTQPGAPGARNGPLPGDCTIYQTTIYGTEWPDAWIPNYNVNWDAESCYYSVQDYCPGVPAADVTYTTSYFNFFPDELAGNKIGNSSVVLPAAGQYFIIKTPLWRYYGQGQWHTWGDNLGSDASPLAVTNGKTPTLGCTHTGTGVASTWGPQP